MPYKGEVKVTYNYNLSLKTDHNFIEYKIEHFYKTDPNVMASFQDEVTVTLVDVIPYCK